MKSNPHLFEYIANGLKVTRVGVSLTGPHRNETFIELRPILHNIFNGP